MDVEESFFRLFIGRGDCYGVFGKKDPETGKRGGGCVKLPLTREHYRRHLHSFNEDDWIGVYPAMGERCSWGCVDLDGKDFDDVEAMLTTARRLQGALAYKDVPAWLEKSDGGYHLWVFPDQPLVASATMRRALMAACTAIGYSPKEVNPKSEDVGRGPGNYVRLPYPGGATTVVRPQRYMVDGDGQRIDLWSFVQLATHGRASVTKLEQIAKLWTPPPVTSLDLGDAPPVNAAIERKLPGLAYTIYKNGPLEGSDRSGTLYRLAHLCADGGMAPEETFAILVNADARWGKYAMRPDRDEQLQRMVEKAHG